MRQQIRNMYFEIALLEAMQADGLPTFVAICGK